jgi:hypothetical protein
MNYDVRRQWQQYQHRDGDLLLLALLCLGLNVFVLGGLLISVLVGR